jgi:opacity protein-like surface antigen
MNTGSPDQHRFNISGGAGFSVPRARAGSNVNTGWNLDVRGGYNISTVDFYVVGGAGLYHRGLNFTQPALFTTLTCDPFFGYCYPVTVTGNQVVASFSTYKFGYNAGAGLEFKLGQTGWKAFTEARYNEMFTSRGKNLTYIPVTFGVRW